MYPYQNPNYYYYQPQMYPYFQRMPKKFNLQHTLHTTIRGIQIANQVIPIIYQVKPLIDNTKQGLTLLKAMNHLNDIDFDEIEKEFGIVVGKQLNLLEMTMGVDNGKPGAAHDRHIMSDEEYYRRYGHSRSSKVADFLMGSD